MSALSTLRALAPELRTNSDVAVQAMIDLVTLRVDTSVLDGRLDEALARIAAHELTMGLRAQQSPTGFSGVGAPASIAGGTFTASFGGGKTARTHEDAHYSQTHHGLAYLQIRDSRADVGFGLLT